TSSDRALALLDLAATLRNVSRACQTMGMGRDSYYRYRRLYEERGPSGLVAAPRSKPNLKNRTPAHVEMAVVALSREQPSWGQIRISKALCAAGMQLSPSGVRFIWQRRGLQTVDERLRRLIDSDPHQPLTDEQRTVLNRREIAREARGTFVTEGPGY